jgi:multidrug resistance efflux pump
MTRPFKCHKYFHASKACFPYLFQISKLEAELANERRQKDFLTAQLSQVESDSTQDKEQIIFRLETQLQEHRTLCEKYENESVSKESAIMQMRTKLATVETELQKVREDSKVRELI